MEVCMKRSPQRPQSFLGIRHLGHRLYVSFLPWFCWFIISCSDYYSSRTLLHTQKSRRSESRWTDDLNGRHLDIQYRDRDTHAHTRTHAHTHTHTHTRTHTRSCTHTQTNTAVDKGQTMTTHGLNKKTYCSLFFVTAKQVHRGQRSQRLDQWIGK
ncbi:hypothetical protein R3I94_019205 [Phoxinus phoxinus]